MAPLMWAYLALMAAATGASAKAQQKTNKARANVAAEERERRAKAQKATEASAQATSDQYLGMKDREKTRAAEVANLYRREAPTPTTTDAGTRFLATDAPRHSTSTIESIGRAHALSAAEANQRTTAMANLGSFGDAFQESNIAGARNAQDIGTQQGFMQGWQQNVLPALYNKANMAGRQWATASDIMKLAATVMGPYAMGAGKAADAAGSTQGVLDQMAGAPSEFAGKNLFGMGKGLPFSDAALTEVVPTAGRAFIDNGIEDLAIQALNPGLFTPGSIDPLQTQRMRERIIQKQLRGGGLTPEEQRFLGWGY